MKNILFNLIKRKDLIYRAILGGATFTAVWWILSYILGNIEFLLGLIGGIVFALTWLTLEIWKD